MDSRALSVTLWWWQSLDKGKNSRLLESKLQHWILHKYSKCYPKWLQHL
jgi:hypothetical protein